MESVPAGLVTALTPLVVIGAVIAESEVVPPGSVPVVSTAAIIVDGGLVRE